MEGVEQQKELMLGDVRALWPRIRPALEEISLKQNPDWIPEDIYHWVMSDVATLYATDDAFAVVQRGQNPITQEKYLLIIVSYSWRAGHNIAGYLPCFDDLARRIGAAYIEVQSKRKGYARVGFDHQMHVYRRRL